MIQYVLGFAFDDLGRVALIRKNKPEWQRGLLNGIGGKVESTESIAIAMKREFYEEAGVRTSDWEHVGKMFGPEWQVDLFTVRHKAIRTVSTKTSEPVELVPLHQVMGMADRMVGNVPMLIQFCLLKDRPFITMQYQGPH